MYGDIIIILKSGYLGVSYCWDYVVWFLIKFGIGNREIFIVI